MSPFFPALVFIKQRTGSIFAKRVWICELISPIRGRNLGILGSKLRTLFFLLFTGIVSKRNNVLTILIVSVLTFLLGLNGGCTYSTLGFDIGVRVG